jgi:hypothetical protein
VEVVLSVSGADVTYGNNNVAKDHLIPSEHDNIKDQETNVLKELEQIFEKTTPHFNLINLHDLLLMNYLTLNKHYETVLLN